MAFATIIGSPALVGSFGASFAVRNIELFGVLAYVYPFVLIYAAYKLYKNPTVDFKRASFSASLSLLFILFLMIQSIVFEGSEYKGVIGEGLVSAITSTIGRGGFWIVWACSFVLSLVLLAEEGVDVLFRKFFAALAKLKPSFNFKRTPKEPKVELQKEQKTLKVEPIKEELPHVEVHPLPQNDESIDGALAAAAEIAEEIAKDTKPKRVKKETLSNVEILTELEENKALLDTIELGETDKPKGWKLPSPEFFAKSQAKKNEANEDEIDEKIKDLLEKLRRFKIEGDVIKTYAGPVVTTFEFKPAPHIKVSRILTLQDDIAMALKAQTIRIQAPIPGKDVVGIEIPNREIETIYMREILESDIFKKSLSPLTLILGKDIVGNPFVTDLKKLPHLLIAGTTGAASPLVSTP